MRDLLQHARLVTMVGAGGTGRSRLALEIAHEIRSLYHAGVWLAELATVTDPHQVLRTVAGTAGAHEHSELSLIEHVAGRFRVGPTLLILDNCEHLLDVAATLARQLLEACPALTVVATSRERLGITGEALDTLPGLALGADDGGLVRCRAAFRDRARATCPDLRLREPTDPVVVRICRQLDGLPLAIELARRPVSP